MIPFMPTLTQLPGIGLLVFLLAPACSGQAQIPAPRQIQLNYRCLLTGLSAADGQVDVWIPVPISDDRQMVTLTTTNLAGGQLNTESKYGNRIYYRRMDLSRVKPTDTLSVQLDYTVSIREKSISEAKKLAPLPKTPVGPDMQVYLAENRLIPLKGPIATLKQNMQLPEAPILAARKAYDYLIDTMVYNYKAPGAGKGDAVWACDSKTGDCSDYHSLFIGVCRASGIPADHVFGLPLRAKEGIAKGYHCWARYYVEGPGWITIDASEADKHPEQRDYLFGTLSDAYLIVAHGRDVNLLPKQQGLPLNNFGTPYAEVNGKPVEGVQVMVTYKEKVN
jgi:transglutaminase-like putative cysteine protease